MSREASLFEDSDGDPVKGYILLRSDGGGNIPPSWIQRSKESRKKLEREFLDLLQDLDIRAIPLLEDWRLRYQKECFYYGIRVLMELERKGKTLL